MNQRPFYTALQLTQLTQKKMPQQSIIKFIVIFKALTCAVNNAKNTPSFIFNLSGFTFIFAVYFENIFTSVFLLFFGNECFY